MHKNAHAERKSYQNSC